MRSDKKKIYFTPAIDKYFAHWILTTTWWTDNLQDEERFHAFVLAVHKNSRLIGRKAGMGRWVRDEEGNLMENGRRNPRTYDTKQFNAKIIEAVKRNHTFDREALEQHATQYAEKAVDILEFLWQTRHGLPDLGKWNPPLQ